MIVTYFGRSEKGLRDNNEDAFFAGRTGDYWLLAVADGLGGHQAGERASAIAIKILREEVEKGKGDPKSLLEQIACQIHTSILAESGTDRNLYGMATTLVAALLDDAGHCTVMNIGDSRAYIIHEGTIRHTRDQNLVSALVACGQISEEEVLNHPLRTMIDQALGDPESEIAPDFYVSTLDSGWIILSSDGFHDFVRKERVMEIVSAGGSIAEICNRLIEEAMKSESDDNVTVVVGEM
jgi:protein phosphatase